MNLTLPFPPSANRYWRSSVRNGSVRVYLSKAGRSYKKAAALIAYSQDSSGPFETPVSVEIDFYFPSRRGDLDNRVKPLLDALQGIAYEDDKQVDRILARRRFDSKNPRAEVRVEAIDR